MSDKSIILTALSIVIVLFLFYMVCFWGTGISKETADWGAFGNYAAISMSVLSIAFIYVTYREQRNTNEIVRTEQHITTMVNTILLLSEKNQYQLDLIYTKFCEHFKEPFYNISDYHYDKIVKVCIYYYSTIDKERINSIKYLIRYTHLSLDFILHNRYLLQDNKQLKLTELAYVIPEPLRIILFLWLIKNDCKELKDYFSYGIFTLYDNSSCLLRDIINYICTTKCPPDRYDQIVSGNDIILDDAPQEQFSETYLRLSSEE